MFNLRHSKKNLLLLLSVILGAQSCINKEDFAFDSLAGVKVNPSVAVPLLYGSLTIKDLLPEERSSSIQTDKDGLIHVVFHDTLKSTSIHDHFLLESSIIDEFYPVALGLLNMGGQQVIVEDQQFLDFGSGDADFEQIILKDGSLEITAGSSLDTDVYLTLTFPSLKKDNLPLVLEMTLPPGSEYTNIFLEAELAGYEADLSTYGMGENVVPINILAEIDDEQNGTVKVTDNITFHLETKDLKFSLLTGHFGQVDVELPSNKIPIALFETLFSKGKFGLKEPAIRFDVLNSNGVPLRVYANTLQARSSTGETLDIATSPAAPMDILYPSEYGKTAITSLIVNNVGEIMELAPSFIEYQLNGRINMTPAPDLNFLTDSSEIAVVLNADIPLWGYLESIMLTDTMKLALEFNDAMVTEASLRLLVENEFPLEAQVQIDFVNEKYDVLETLFTGGYESLLPASTVNSNGELVSAGKYNKDIEFTSERFERILKANKMIIKAILHTTKIADGSYPHVKIKTDYKLNVDLGVKTTANLTMEL